MDLFKCLDRLLYVSYFSWSLTFGFLLYYGAFLNSSPASDLEMQYLRVPSFAVKSLKLMALADRLGKIREWALTNKKIRTGYLDSKVLLQWLKNKIQTRALHLIWNMNTSSLWVYEAGNTGILQTSLEKQPIQTSWEWSLWEVA